ncbi:hypothetical protein [Streptomyces sp. NPDC046909]|uniref:hypothetical protein n=1 Tax=Streptomyces sp. NPDC046909 TaxID=3155617 RepID=UPI0033EC19DF
MTRPCLDRALLVGDYLPVAGYRVTTEPRRPGEGYARIEWVEHIHNPSFVDPDSMDVIPELTDALVAVCCQGLPGPVLLRSGDHRVLTEVAPERLVWDAEHPTWSMGKPLFVGGQVPRKVHWSRGDLAAPVGVSPKTASVPPTRRAASFAKPASALCIGDYLRIHVQFPKRDRGIDEGYHRVEWLAHLTGEGIAGLLVDPTWANGTVTLVTVQGLGGMLVLPEADVHVQVQPNVERTVWDKEDTRRGGPPFTLTGAVEPDPDVQRAKDADHRPAAPEDEADLYPTVFSTPEARTLHLDGVTAVRAVPASALPWPHSLFRCEYAGRGKRIARTYPGGDREDQTAHAELFAELTEEEFAACPYHQGDWQAIAEAVLACAEVDEDEEPDRARELYAMSHLSPQDRQWAQDMVRDNICWDEGDSSLTNGQHRLCAMRAAGVVRVPVHGRFLPGAEMAVVTDAQEHARQTVETYWIERLTELWGPGPWPARLGPVLAGHRILRWLLPRPERRRE